jgi:hypothetical protein
MHPDDLQGGTPDRGPDASSPSPPPPSAPPTPGPALPLPPPAGVRRVRKRWVVTVAVVVAGIALWLWIGRGPGRGGHVRPERFVPLAAELEGIRGVRLYYGIAGSDSLGEEFREGCSPRASARSSCSWMICIGRTWPASGSSTSC